MHAHEVFQEIEAVAQKNRVGSKTEKKNKTVDSLVMEAVPKYSMSKKTKAQTAVGFSDCLPYSYA